ncbi:MAG: polymer-forming cytoskeletal protein [Clostridiales bacterium]
MKIKAILKQNNGTALVWVVTTMVVLLILTGGIMTMVASYHAGSVAGNSLNQAYFSARSGVNAVVAELTKDTETPLSMEITKLVKAESGFTPTTINLGTVNFGDKKTMGTCDVRLIVADKDTTGENKDKYRIFVEGTATVGKETNTVVAQVNYQNISATPVTWPDYVYVKNSTGNDLRFLTVKNGSLYLEPMFHAVTGGENIKESHAILSYTGSTGNKDYNYSSVTDNLYSQGNLSLVGSVAKDDTSEYANTIGGSVYTSEKCVDIDGKNEKPTTVTVAGKYKVMGGISTPGNVVVKGDALVNSNIEANSLTIEDNATVNGNITVNTLKLSSGAKVNGNIICTNWKMDSNYSIYPLITGNVSCKNFSSNSTTSKTVVNGTFTWETCKAIKNITTIDDFNKTFPGFATSVVIGKINEVKPPVSKMPRVNPPITFPSIAELQSKKMFSEFPDKKVSLANAQGKNTYYLMDKQTNNTKLKIGKGGNVFLYIPAGIDFDTSTINYEPLFDKERPNVFIIAEGTSTDKKGISTIRVKKDSTFNGYLYGKANSSIIVEHQVIINGGLFGDQVDAKNGEGAGTIVMGEGVVFNLIPLDGKGTIDKEIKYYVSKYLDNLPQGVGGAK